MQVVQDKSNAKKEASQKAQNKHDIQASKQSLYQLAWEINRIIASWTLVYLGRRNLDFWREVAVQLILPV